jgi:hypothetical protein
MKHPRQHNDRHTEAEKRALEAVRDGQVTRLYHATGNVLRGPKGVGANVLWRLFRQNLFTDGPDDRGVLNRTCVQVLTGKGQAALTSTMGTKS